MKKVYPLILFFCSIMLCSQNQTNIWYFGENAGVSFSSNAITPITNGNINTLEGCSSYADENGNLLFYSDGSTLWNKQHQIMQYSNGNLADNLLGNTSSTQAALTVPHPLNNNIFYLFTVDDLTGTDGLNVYTIDISKNNGLGEVVSSPQDLSINATYKNNWSERLTAIQSSNCNSYWLVSQSGNTFISYKIDENGLNTSPVISTTNYTPEEKGGYLKISPDGTKLAIADAQHYSDNYGVVIFDFNDETGQVSQNGEIISTRIEDGTPYGVEFSKTSNKLYVSTYSYFRNSINDPTTSTYKLLQFDVTQQNIRDTKSIIYTDVDGFRGALQLASNGKIYAAITKAYLNGGADYLSVIENPDADANEVIFTKNAVHLAGKKITQGLPPFIQSFFASTNILEDATNEVLTGNQTFYLGDSHILRSQIQESGATYTWKKDGNILGNESTLNVTDGVFGNGQYTLEVQLASCKKLIATIHLTFEEKPVITYENCDNDTNTMDGIATFNLQSRASELARNSSTSTVEFFEKSDTSFTSPLPNEYRNENNPVTHDLAVRITDSSSGQQTFDELRLKVFPTVMEDFPTIFTIEDDLNANNPNATFSLGANETSVDFGSQIQQIKNLYTEYNNLEVKLYPSENDAQNEENEIVTPYSNYSFSNNSEVFVKLFVNGSSCTNSIGKFTITVYKLPEPLGNDTQISLCANSENDTAELDADTENSTDTYKWYLNGNLIANATEAIYNATEIGTYRVEAIRNYPEINAPVIGYNTFVVGATSSSFSIESLEHNNDNNSIDVTVNGDGDFEYSLDGITFQTGFGNTFSFENIENGLHTIYVKDSNGCGGIVSKEISVLQIQNFLTPNNDGIKDTWSIDISKNPEYERVTVVIVDRFGKTISQLENNQSWNGTFQGQNLPPKTYWYVATFWGNNGSLTKRKGGISLIRN